MNPLTLIPALYRKWLYSAFFVVGVLLGAIQVATAAGAAPDWLDNALAVYAYVGTALGLTAASNVGPEDGPPPAPTD